MNSVSRISLAVPRNRNWKNLPDPKESLSQDSDFSDISPNSPDLLEIGGPLTEILHQIREEEGQHTSDCRYLSFLPCSCGHRKESWIETSKLSLRINRYIFQLLGSEIPSEPVEEWMKYEQFVFPDRLETVNRFLHDFPRHYTEIIMALVYLTRVQEYLTFELSSILIVSALIAAVIYHDDTDDIEGIVQSFSETYLCSTSLITRCYVSFLRMIDYRLYIPDYEYWNMFEKINRNKEGFSSLHGF
jgi:hypothetical protein